MKGRENLKRKGRSLRRDSGREANSIPVTVLDRERRRNKIRREDGK